MSTKIGYRKRKAAGAVVDCRAAASSPHVVKAARQYGFIDQPYFAVVGNIFAATFGHTAHCGDMCIGNKCQSIFQLPIQLVPQNVPKDRLAVLIRVRVADDTPEALDEFPYMFEISVNHMSLFMPKYQVVCDGKIPVVRGRILEVTPCLMDSEGNMIGNHNLCLSWSKLDKRMFVISVRFVVKRTAQELMGELFTRPQFDTTMVLKNVFDGSTSENDISFCSIKTDVNCPLSLSRPKNPCRSIHCTHLGCFDAEIFLVVNKEQINWRCPICRGSAQFCDLRIDKLMSNILQSLSGTSERVEIFYDGTWEDIDSKTTNGSRLTSSYGPSHSIQSKRPRLDDDIIDIISLSSDSEGDDDQRRTNDKEEFPADRPSLRSPSLSISDEEEEIIDLTGTSDEDDFHDSEEENDDDDEDDDDPLITVVNGAPSPNIGSYSAMALQMASMPSLFTSTLIPPSGQLAYCQIPVSYSTMSAGTDSLRAVLSSNYSYEHHANTTNYVYSASSSIRPNTASTSQSPVAYIIRSAIRPPPPHNNPHM